MDSATGGQAQGKVPARAEIDLKYTWDLSALYPDTAAWESDFRACEQGASALAAMKGSVTRSPGDLLKFLKLSDDVSSKLSRAGAYASQLRDQDTRQSGIASGKREGG